MNIDPELDLDFDLDLALDLDFEAHLDLDLDLDLDPDPEGKEARGDVLLALRAQMKREVELGLNGKARQFGGLIPMNQKKEGSSLKSSNRNSKRNSKRTLKRKGSSRNRAPLELERLIGEKSRSRT